MKLYKPTTPSRRGMSVVDYNVLTKKKPEKSLTAGLKKSAGRSSSGKISVRHKGGGHKRQYRIIDFKRDKFDVPGNVSSVEYDPNRTAFIALIKYADGDKRYILAPTDLKVGDRIVTSQKAELKTGNRLFLKNIPVGLFVYNIELIPKKGGQLARSAGCSVQVRAHENEYVHLLLPSSEIRKVRGDCLATIGSLSNSENNLVNIGKAGRSRWMGIRPTVRGSAMNPCDHPYGGGEGRQPRGTKRPKNKWGKGVRGQKTRKKKKMSSKYIIRRRIKK